MKSTCETPREALRRACAKGDLDLLKELIEIGVNVSEIYTTYVGENNVIRSNISPMEIAAWEGNVNIVEHIVSLNLPIGDSLYWAASNGWVDVIKYLISVGADVNKTYDGYYDDTPLHIACQKCHIDAVNVLLNAGANPSLTNKCENTPLYEVILWYKVKNEEAALAIMNRLVMHGANINVRNKKGYTPLMYIIVHSPKFLRGIELLIAYGCDVNIVNDLQETPLSYAIEYGHGVELIKILLNAGANPNFIGKDGVTCLQVARSNGRETIVKLLLDVGAY